MPRLAISASTLALGLAAARAGVVQGIAIEHISGLPMARAQVRLQLVTPQGFQQTAAVLTTRTGQFAFQNIPDGYYVVSAIRESYHLAYYGERRPGGAGAAIAVARDSNLFVELRLRHLGAITGRTLDENRVAIPNVPVVAYTTQQPLRAIASGKSDDRGVFRIPNLPPAKYYVRSGGLNLAPGAGITPTFSPENPQPKDARVVATRLDADSTDADIAPIFGLLFTASGDVHCSPLGMPLTVTLSSDIGRTSYETACGASYAFENLPLGAYELLAAFKTAEPAEAVFEEIRVNRQPTLTRLQPRLLEPIAAVIKEREGGAVPGEATAIIRRVDLAGAEQPKPKKAKAPLLPGYWEVSATLPANYYIASVRIGNQNRTRRNDREFHPDWFGVFVDPRYNDTLEIVISAKGARITGSVTTGANPAIGAPVHLWPVSSAARRGINGPKVAYTDAKGVYGFQGLAPGDYVLFSSYDYTSFDEDLIGELNLAPIRVSDGQGLAKDLTLLVTGR